MAMCWPGELGQEEALLKMGEMTVPYWEREPRNLNL